MIWIPPTLSTCLLVYWWAGRISLLCSQVGLFHHYVFYFNFILNLLSFLPSCQQKFMTRAAVINMIKIKLIDDDHFLAQNYSSNVYQNKTVQLSNVPWVETFHLTALLIMLTLFKNRSHHVFQFKDIVGAKYLLGVPHCRF